MHKAHDAGVYNTPMPKDLEIVGDDWAPLDDAKAKAAMPRDCPTPKACREHCCHGACLPESEKRRYARENKLAAHVQQICNPEKALVDEDGILRCVICGVTLPPGSLVPTRDAPAGMVGPVAYLIEFQGNHELSFAPTDEHGTVCTSLYAKSDPPSTEPPPTVHMYQE